MTVSAGEQPRPDLRPGGASYLHSSRLCRGEGRPRHQDRSRCGSGMFLMGSVLRDLDLLRV